MGGKCSAVPLCPNFRRGMFLGAMSLPSVPAHQASIISTCPKGMIPSGRSAGERRISSRHAARSSRRPLWVGKSLLAFVTRKIARFEC
jgi:hypothetical protein